MSTKGNTPVVQGRAAHAGDPLGPVHRQTLWRGRHKVFRRIATFLAISSALLPR
jgi:hypothetical protein